MLQYVRPNRRFGVTSKRTKFLVGIQFETILNHRELKNHAPSIQGPNFMARMLKVIPFLTKKPYGYVLEAFDLDF